MKIIAPSVALEWMTLDPLGMIEQAGRTCYQSEPKGDPESFVRMLVKRGHESVIEHASASFRIVTDRGVTHELVRHRLSSYSQESTRYCRYGGGIAVIEPPGLDWCDSDHILSYCPRTSPCPGHWWLASVSAAERAYIHLLSVEVSPQIARSVLPTCTKTEIVATANLREWRHILRLRTAPAAHPQMRDIADRILATFLATQAAVVFEDLLPSIDRRSSASSGG